MTQAQYDITLFGATSFVGKIIVKYLLDQFPDKQVSWAMAGRSEQKLIDLKSELGESANKIPVLVVDANDPDALESMCQQSQVIMTTVGPYDLYGEPVVKACVENGTDYCDLTGEPHWIKKMLDKYEDAAKASGARIVHCTGFDSIPSDLGVYHLQREARKAFGSHCGDVRLRIRNMRGAASGGTIATALNIAKQIKTDPQVKKVLVNPYALCPKDHGYKSRQKQDKLQYDDTFNSWVGPFFMASINTRIVHRSNALSNNSYGSEFTYNEGVMTGKGWKAKTKARAIYWGLAAFFTGASIGPIRAFLSRFVLTKPGDGPDQRARMKGFYDFRFVGVTDEGDQIITKVYGDRDPGYGSTAKIMSQAAVCLAQDVDATAEGGFWTPASLLGQPLIQRLHNHAGVTFEVISIEKKQ